ncbi:MAG: hypothetical protein AABY30_05770 [Candidatus Thermoplasmatota archaeon]
MEGRTVAPPMEESRLTCDICGAPAFELHCKVICRRCGYTRDCGDP